MYFRWQRRKLKHPRSGRWHRTVSSNWGSPEHARGRERLKRVVHYIHQGEGDDAYRQDVAWTAIIVENVRVNGKPKQQHVAYLATICESELVHMGARIRFWDKVTKRLDGLSNRILADDRAKIEAAIEAQLPRPTPEERQQNAREREQWTEGLKTLSLFAGMSRRRRAKRSPEGSRRPATD
jgi:hypothetical protein